MVGETYKVTTKEGKTVYRTRIRGRGGSSIIRQSDEAGKVIQGDPNYLRLKKAEQDNLSKANYQDIKGELYNIQYDNYSKVLGGTGYAEPPKDSRIGAKVDARGPSSAPYSNAYLSAVRTQITKSPPSTYTLPAVTRGSVERAKRSQIYQTERPGGFSGLTRGQYYGLTTATGPVTDVLKTDKAAYDIYGKKALKGSEYLKASGVGIDFLGTAGTRVTKRNFLTDTQTGNIQNLAVNPAKNAALFALSMGAGAAVANFAASSSTANIFTRAAGSVGAGWWIGTEAANIVTSKEPFIQFGRAASGAAVVIGGASIGKNIANPQPKTNIKGVLVEQKQTTNPRVQVKNAQVSVVGQKGTQSIDLNFKGYGKAQTRIGRYLINSQITPKTTTSAVYKKNIFGKYSYIRTVQSPTPPKLKNPFVTTETNIKGQPFELVTSKGSIYAQQSTSAKSLFYTDKNLNFDLFKAVNTKSITAALPSYKYLDVSKGGQSLYRAVYKIPSILKPTSDPNALYPSQGVFSSQTIAGTTRTENIIPGQPYTQQKSLFDIKGSFSYKEYNNLIPLGKKASALISQNFNTGKTSVNIPELTTSASGSTRFINPIDITGAKLGYSSPNIILGTSMPRTTPKTGQNNIYRPDIKVISPVDNKQPTLFKNPTKTKIEIKNVLKPSTITEQGIKPGVKIDTIQILEQEQTPIQITTPRSKPITTPFQKFKNPSPSLVFPRPRLPPAFIPPIKKGGVGYSNKNIGTGFNVFVKRKGIFSRANQQVYSRKDAINYGAFVVGNTAAATFKIKPSSTGITGSFFGGNLGDFYRKGDLFIEKIGRRIKSKGEKDEITFKGLVKRRGKKLFKGVFK